MPHPPLLIIASDHAGYDLKEHLKQAVKEGQFGTNLRILDAGVGATSTSADYPDYALELIKIVRHHPEAVGILICGTGVGMSIAANRVPDIRAALCTTPEMARIARRHNDANVLVLGARVIDRETALLCIEAFLTEPFEGGRHHRRVQKLGCILNVTAGDLSMDTHLNNSLTIEDPIIARAIQDERHRQETQIEMIASENFVSQAVMEAQGSVLTNKYAEGYPGRRYYGGCEYVDVVEQCAIDRAKALFDCAFANVQPHSGSQANQAVFLSFLAPGDTYLAMGLDAGGHLTHGSKVNQSGKWFNPVSYGVNLETGFIDYDEVEAKARQAQPKLIIAGGSAYARTLDFERFRWIADQVGALLMVDMAHYAGLIAGGAYPSPIPHAHVITSTTHKTLRGPRGGLILSNDPDLSKKINSAIFPGLQGGPLPQVIAAKAVAFGEALQPNFRLYAARIVENAKALATALQEKGIDLVSHGTDSHMVLVDLRAQGVTGADMEKALDMAGITCNKNFIPGDPLSPMVTSGIRLGTPAMTTRGVGVGEMQRIAAIIADTIPVLKAHGLDPVCYAELKARSRAITRAFPLYERRG